MLGPSVYTVRRFWVIFFLLKKNNIYVSVQRVICCSHQSYRVGYVSRTNQIAALGYVSRTNQIAALGYVSRTNQCVVFVLWFERCSNFSEVMGDSERAVRRMETSIRMRNVAVFLTCNLPCFMRNATLLERWKIIRLPVVNVLLILWKWWIVVRE